MENGILDLRGVPCPANAARALMKIATMDQGETIVIWLQDGEPLQNLVPSLEEAGHKILERHPIDPNHWSVMVEAGE